MEMRGSLLLILLALCSTGWCKMVARCPPGWEMRGGYDQCYLVHNSKKHRSFQDAREYCQARGGDLAYIDTVALKGWLSRLVTETEGVTPVAAFWVGAEEVDGKWMWTEIDKPVDPLVIQFDTSGVSGECAALKVDSRLKRYSCDLSEPFICHRNISTPPSCDYASEWHEQNHMCYKVPWWSNSWHDAQVECEMEGGSLATITDDFEQQHALDLALYAKDSLWIGLTEEHHPGDFEWVDGSPLNYTYWQPDQPDTSQNGYGSAVVDYGDYYGQWEVHKITDDFHFLCKRKEGACMAGWEVFEDSCYYFNHDEGDLLEWGVARDMCEGVGGSLLVLDSPDEDTYILRHIGEEDTYWIGLYSDVDQNKIVWVDGSEMMSKNFTHMTDEDINNTLDAVDSKCIIYDNLDGTSYWVPVECNQELNYICEVPAGQPITLIPPDNFRYCPVGWSLSDWDYCYMFPFLDNTWPSARSYCSGYGADLVSILTWPEQDFVFDHIKGDTWIGMNDRNEEGNLDWSDGSNFLISNFASGEPGNSHGNCIMISKATGEWYGRACEMVLNIACKRRASTSPIGTITTTTYPPDSSACGSGWIENKVTGECYHLVLEELNLANARLHCQELPSNYATPDLLSIYSPQEQTFIHSFLMQQELSQTSVWLGLVNTMDGVFWVDNSSAPYFNWQDGQPEKPYENECVEMSTVTGKWRDSHCNYRHAFICEKKGPNYIGPQPPTPEPTTCPEGWSFFRDSCYYLSFDTTSWHTANSLCHNNLDTDLASIADPDENQYIQDMMGSVEGNIWVGLHDDNESAWYWTDGSPVLWTNWGEEEPGGQGHCGKMEVYTGDPISQGLWSTAKCSDQNYYVCKFPLLLCPSSMVYREGMCYYSAGDNKAQWQTARTLCKEVNTKADLVTIPSQQVNEFVTDNLLNTHQTNSWIGLSYNQATAEWTWPNGSPLTYTNWDTNEPDNIDKEKCTAIVGNTDFNNNNNGRWQTYTCGSYWEYVCEMRPTHIYGCEEGWTHYPPYCYLYSKSQQEEEDHLTFNQARDRCAGMGGELVSIHTQAEDDFVFSLTSDGSTETSTWLGLTDEGSPMNFRWTDKTDVTFTSWDRFYNNPFPSYPSCVQYKVGSDGLSSWGVQMCETEQYFICKKQEEPIELDQGNTGCYEGHQAYKGSCYAVSGSTLDWESAVDACKSYNTTAHLVVLNDVYETSYLSSLVGRLGSAVWLGLRRVESTGDGDGDSGDGGGDGDGDGAWSFEWVNGDPVDFTYWAESEPAPGHGNCVAASGEKNTPGLWYLTHCQDSFKFVCEYPRPSYTTPPPVTTPHPSSYCLHGWHHINDRCYKVVNTSYTWGQGEQVCVSYGGHLASIGSLSEQTIIQALPELGQVDDIYNSVWIGLRAGAESGYEWTDGTPVDFLDWGENQPNTDEGRRMCGSADVTSIKMSMSNCAANLPVICEARQGTMVTTASPPTKPPIQTCPDGDSWLLYGDSCYKFISETEGVAESWWQSHVLCVKEGGELASVHTMEENYWIEAMISSLPDAALWLGGRSRLGSGYEWLDESGFDYVNWDDGEPNNAYDEEDCISIYTHKLGYWSDKNCGHALGRVCKRPHGNTHPPHHTTTTPPGHCANGWLHTGSKCVHVNSTRSSFSEARAACQSMGADLASVHSSAQQAYVTALASGVGVDVWLGMRYNDGFHWVDQTTVTYTNWAQGQPNGHTDGEECVLASYTSGRWDDVSCVNENGYICMKDQDPSIDYDPKLPSCTPAAAAASDVTFIPYNGACYWTSHIPNTWQMAEKKCSQYSSHLTSVLGVGEDSWMWVLGQEDDLEWLWLGLSNIQDHKVFRWSDGWPAVYTNWGPGQPNLNSSRHECVQVNGADGLWYVQACDVTLPFVCKYTNESVLTPDPPVDGYCPDARWLDLGGAFCYLFSHQHLDWSAADLNCLQEGSNLASIHSGEEVKLISMAISNITDPFWIGLVQNANGFGWSDGTGLDYINWDHGEPNNENHKCIQMYPNTGSWNDADCASLVPSLCKVQKIPLATQPPPPPTQPPTDNSNGGDGGGGGGGNGGLSPGGIVGIVVLVCTVVAVLGLIYYSYTNTRRSKPTPKNTTSTTPGKGVSVEVRMSGVSAASEA